MTAMLQGATLLIPANTNLLPLAIQTDAVEHIKFESPSTITQFGDGAFVQSHNLKSIVIPASVKLIGVSCFSELDALTSVEFESGSRLIELAAFCFAYCASSLSIRLPSSLQRIGSSCFSSCSDLASVTFDHPSQLLEIGVGAFLLCQSLISILIPASVTYLDANCFRECSQLARVGFESGSRLREIGRYAFRGCPDLLEICLPPLLETIDGSAFVSARRPEVSIDPANQKFELLNHFVMETKTRSLVMYFGNDDHVVIPSSIRFISPRFMFSEENACSIGFESPSTVTEFGESALTLCLGLIVIVLPASLEIIANKYFRHCEELRCVTFESGSKLTTIGDLAFSDCDSPTTITIPASVRRIGKHCFVNCPSLTQILFESQSQVYAIGDFGECLLEWIDIPDSVEVIGSLPFAREDSSCVVMFGQESQLVFVSVVDIESESAVYRRAFARYSEGTLRRLRSFAESAI
jgi:hypothetical protein